LEKISKEIHMRPLTKCLTAAVALACAQATMAATTTSFKPAPSGTPSVLNNGTVIRSAITTPAGSSATLPSSITINQPNAVQPRAVDPNSVTTVDVRAQQTAAATAGTHSSGSTSSLGPLANNGASSVNSGTGTTSGTGATGTGSSTGTTTTTTTTGGAVVGSPFLVNPSDLTTGAFANNASALPLASNGMVGSSDVYSAPVLASNGIAVTEDQLVARANAGNVDRAINQVQRDRKRMGRNGQLLYSIAPRTNVDRSKEMPDDGPSPALSGYNSALAR